MEVFMPKIWIPNIEEILELGESQEYLLLEKMSSMMPGFLVSLKEGDVFVSPSIIGKDFVAYLERLMGFTKSIKIIECTNRMKPFRLVEAILSDTEIISELKRIVTNGEWAVQAYYDSPLIHKLAAELNISPGQNADENVVKTLIPAINNKYRFKLLMAELGIATVNGVFAGCRRELSAAVKKMSVVDQPIMVRKCVSGGGLGNLALAVPEDYEKLEHWYHDSEVLVEPYLNIAQTLGSLAVVTEDGCRFLGIDEQLLEGSRWIGFRYPCNSKHNETIENGTLKLAEFVRANGGYGYINIDWAVTVEGECLALECNYRQNGFSRVLNLATRLLGERARGMHIIYCESISCRDGCSFQELSERLSLVEIQGKKVLIDTPGMKSGAVMVSPPSRGRVALGIFGPDPEYAETVFNKCRTALS